MSSRALARTADVRRLELIAVGATGLAVVRGDAAWQPRALSLQHVVAALLGGGQRHSVEVAAAVRKPPRRVKEESGAVVDAAHAPAAARGRGSHVPVQGSAHHEIALCQGHRSSKILLSGYHGPISPAKRGTRGQPEGSRSWRPLVAKPPAPPSDVPRGVRLIGITRRRN